MMKRGGPYSPRVILLSILLAAFLLRAFQFSFNPPGLYFDEATAGYESLSLLHTGADRWSVPFPVYFINWSSGQNVLYSYLSIPFVVLFGLSRFSVRLLSLFLGILTLPILYVTVKRRLGENSALVATALLAILPWHIMVSRWALESNILPVFILLGSYTLTRALERNAPRRWIVLALFPWALALYAYLLGAIVLPIMLALIFIMERKSILENWKAWLVSVTLFAILAFPMALFLIKNFIVHDTLEIERFLPFGIPLLLTSRLQSVSSPIPARWLDSFFFILSGFQEGDYHDSIMGHAPIFIIFLPLCLVGAVYWIRESRQARRAELFLLWLLSSVPVLLLVDANVHRFNVAILPVLVASAYGLVKLGDALGAAPRARNFLIAGASALVALQAALFAFDYFLALPNVPEYQSAYTANYDRAIAKGLAMAPPSDPILLQPSLEFSYIFVLFYTSYPPEAFHREAKYTLEYSEYWVRSFGRFYVGEEKSPRAARVVLVHPGQMGGGPLPGPNAILGDALVEGRAV